MSAKQLLLAQRAIPRAAWAKPNIRARSGIVLERLDARSIARFDRLHHGDLGIRRRLLRPGMRRRCIQQRTRTICRSAPSSAPALPFA
jgi:hypothetical protein